VHATLTAPPLAPAAVDGSHAAAGASHDDVAAPPIEPSIDEAAGSLDEAIHAARSDVGLVASRPAVSAPGGRPGAGACVAGDGLAAQIIFPGCTNRIFLEGHHIRHWADGGETSLQNTTLLCTLHHRHVHEYGYTIELGPDRRPRFRDRHGRWVAAVPESPRVADLGWPQIRAENEALAIDADTIAGPWDGTPVDYGRIVGHLAAADGLA
jgi:hypothetical protein